MTQMPNFWSHLNKLADIPIEKLKYQPVLGGKKENGNVVALPYFYDPEADPYKFYTLHCFLYPQLCNRNLKRLLINVYDPR